MEKDGIEKLVEDVRQIAYEVHVYLGNGYLEKVYENCLRHRFIDCVSQAIRATVIAKFFRIW